MAQTKVGIIAEKSIKPWQGDKGMINLYSFTLQGDRTYYRTGTTDIQFNSGDCIRFVTDGQKVDLTTIEAADASEVAAQAPSPQAPAQAFGGKPKEDWNARSKYWDAKEIRDVEVIQPNIQQQSARNASISLVDILLREKALPDFTTAKAAERMDIVLDAVDLLTDRFVERMLTETS
jgi:hypothetical protein